MSAPDEQERRVPETDRDASAPDEQERRTHRGTCLQDEDTLRQEMPANLLVPQILLCASNPRHNPPEKRERKCRVRCPFGDLIDPGDSLACVKSIGAGGFDRE